MKNLSVTFHVQVYASGKGFNFPSELAKLLGFKRHSEIALVITKPAGEVIFCGVGKFTSYTEITQAAIHQHFEPGEWIRVSAWKPPPSPKKSRQGRATR